MRKIFTIFLLVSMMCVSICGCSSASARQETLLTIEEKTEVDALETAITATDANQTIEEPEGVVHHTEGVDGFSDDIDYLSIMKQSCLNGDYEAGVVAEKARNKKIDVLGLNVTKVFFEDLLELSRQNVATSVCPLSGSWLLARWLSTELTRQSSQTQSKRSFTQRDNMLTRIQTISKT